jgi:hypothetical protein
MPQPQSQLHSDWSEAETTTHQDHVIKHVLGATVLGWFVAGEAAHLLLDMGFVWTIYLDGEMNLLPQGVAIGELDADGTTAIDKTELSFDADLLLSQGREAAGLKRFSSAPEGCLIETVELMALNSQRRIVIRGEAATINVETSLESGDVNVNCEATPI